MRLQNEQGRREDEVFKRGYCIIPQMLENKCKMKLHQENLTSMQWWWFWDAKWLTDILTYNHTNGFRLNNLNIAFKCSKMKKLEEEEEEEEGKKEMEKKKTKKKKRKVKK